MLELVEVQERLREAESSGDGDVWRERYARDVAALLAELGRTKAELDELVRERWAVSCGSCG